MPSINEQLEQLPTLRHSAGNMKGMLLYLPRTKLTVVATQQVSDGYYCTIVEGNDTYPRGGHDIFVSDREMLRAEHIRITE